MKGTAGQEEWALTNTEILNQYFSGNLAFADSVLEVLQQQIPEYIAEIEASVKENNHSRILSVLHILRPSFIMVGLQTLADDCKDLELKLLTQKTHFQGLGELIQALMPEMQRALEHINQTQEWIQKKLKT